MSWRVLSRLARETVTLGVGVLAGSWFLILTVLVLDLVGVLRRGTGFRWQAVGLLIINTPVSISGFASFITAPSSVRFSHTSSR